MKKKAALVLAGGGAKGAYQAGALTVIDHMFDWTSVHGVSVGALNGFPIAFGRRDMLALLWKEITFDSVAKRRGILRLAWGFLLHKIGIRKAHLGIASNKPLQKLVESILVEFAESKTTLKTLFSAGRVSLTTGAYVDDFGHMRVGDIVLDPSSMAKKIVASTAIPMTFDPVEMNGQLWVDGGINTIAPVLAATKDEEAEVIVVVLMTNISNPKPSGSINSLLDVTTRSIDLMTDQILRDDIEEARNKEIYGGRNRAILVLQPSEDLGSGMDFSRKELDRRFQLGLSDATRLDIWS